MRLFDPHKMSLRLDGAPSAIVYDGTVNTPKEGPRMQTMLQLLLKEEGQGMAEYALILCFVALVAIGGLALLGPKIRDAYITVSNNF